MFAMVCIWFICDSFYDGIIIFCDVMVLLFFFFQQGCLIVFI